MSFIRVAESTSSAASSAGQASADRKATFQGNAKENFASLVNGAETPKTPLLGAVTFASSQA